MASNRSFLNSDHSIGFKQFLLKLVVNILMYVALNISFLSGNHGFKQFPLPFE